MVKIRYPCEQGAMPLVQGHICFSFITSASLSCFPTCKRGSSKSYVPLSLVYELGQPLLPAVVLSKGKSIVCILLKGKDVPLLLPLLCFIILSLVTMKSLVDSGNTFLMVTKQLACWVCPELPNSSAIGLPGN